MFKLQEFKEFTSYDEDFDNPKTLKRWADIDYNRSVEKLREKIPPERSRLFRIVLCEVGDMAKIDREKKLKRQAADMKKDESKYRQIKLF